MRRPRTAARRASSTREPHARPGSPIAPVPAPCKRRSRRLRRTGCGPSRAPHSRAPLGGAVAVLDLPRGQLLERDREVVPGWRVDHRRRVLLIAALAESAVVAVELSGALRDHDHGGVVRVGLREQSVDAWLDHLWAILVGPPTNVALRHPPRDRAPTHRARLVPPGGRF